MNEGELARGLRAGLDPLVKAIEDFTKVFEDAMQLRVVPPAPGREVPYESYEPESQPVVQDQLDGAIQDLKSELKDTIEDLERAVEELRGQGLG